MKFVTIALMITCLFACSLPDRKTGNVDNQSKGDTINYEHEGNMVFNHDYLKKNGDSIEIPGFEVMLELSDKAERALSASSETIIVVAYFTGRAVDKVPERFKKNIDHIEVGILCSYSVELTDNRTARFNGVKFHKDLYNLLADKDIELLINVCSGRKSSPDNILDGDIFQGKMSSVAGKTFTLKEKLIGE